MSMYLISYELRSEIKDYTELYASIKHMGAWQHPVDSVWFVKTRLRATAIYESLKYHIGEEDNLFVVRVDISDMEGWLPRIFWDWIKSQENV